MERGREKRVAGLGGEGRLRLGLSGALVAGAA